MTDHKDDLLPESPVAGLIPTMNNMGWMTESLDDVSLAFTDFAAQGAVESLDIGCAYGVATLTALDKGARILACDIEPKHLDVLTQRVPAAAESRYRCRAGALPAIDFEPGQFDAILASRVLHFLNGADVETTVAKMFAWLRPAGRVFLVADSPYTGPWRESAADYERRKAAGELWPGFLADYAKYLPATADPAKHPSFINPMDPDILSRVCSDAGFEVLEARFLSGSTKWSNGREHAGIIAERP